MLALHLTFLGLVLYLVVSVSIPVNKLTNAGDLSLIGEHANKNANKNHLGTKVFSCHCKILLAF